ncbi:MAG: LCP family protein [Acidimicrobiia bacterium]|nr:LCP family protein [Acidimicrobiia bacterium]
MTGESAVRSRRARYVRRAVILIVSLPLSAMLVAGLLVGAWLAGIRVPVASGTTWFQVTKTGEAHFSDGPDGPVFVLAIGNDYRPGVDGRRGDALHLIGVNKALGQATILNFPRDLGVPIPGHGTTKINAANAYGGPRLTAQTIGALVGIDIPYVIETDFAGFQAMVDEMGGLDVDVPYAMDDHYSGAVFAPGPTHMNGAQALAFSRDRYDHPTGDIKRTENQGLLIISALAQLRAQGTGAAGTLKGLAVLGRHTTLDGVGLGDLYRLARLGLSIDPAQVRNVVVPVGSGRGSNLALAGAAQGLFEDFRDDGVLQSH